MMKIQYKILAVLFTTVSLLFLFSCAEEPAPTLMDLPSGGQPAPVINTIEPANVGLAGVTVLTISGANFATGDDQVSVTFNGVKGTILSVTNTEIKVRAANVIGDSIKIKVTSFKSENFSNTLLFKLEAAVSEYYPFDGAQKFEFPFGIWADNQDNVFVSLQGLGTKKIVPTTVPSLEDFAPKGPESFFRAITLASDDAIYAVRGGVKGVYKAVENTAPVAFVSSSNGITDNVNDVEFDINRNVIWGGGATGIIYSIALDKTVRKFNIDGSINAIRLAGNNLFVASKLNNDEIVWKVPVVSADSLGTAAEYFNVTSSISNSLSIKDIALSEDGDLYIGTDSDTDPIYVVHPDKTFEVLYPGLIAGQVYSLSWNYGDNLFMSNVIGGSNKTVLKIKMQKLGAH